MIEAFRIPFMQQALLAAVLVSSACAFLAVFVVLKRIVFVGMALAQLSSAGVALGLMLGLMENVHLTLFSLLFMLAGVALFAAPVAGRRLPRESLVGAVYSLASALGVLLVARSAAGESRMLGLLFGNILAASPWDNLTMAAVFAGIGLVHWLFHKEFVFVSFDPEMAQTVGLRAGAWDLLLHLTLGATIAVAIRTAGALLVFTFLVVPGMVGLGVGRGLRAAFVASVVAAVVPAVVGLYLSFALDLPTAATMVVLSLAVLLLSAPLWRVLARAGA